MKITTYARFFLRLTIAVLFGYFGYHAVTSPQEQALVWIRPEFQNIILYVMPLTVFMVILGSMQLLVAVAFLLNKYLKLAGLLAVGLLVGIIINLGFGELALRDLVIMAAIGYLVSEKWHVA